MHLKRLELVGFKTFADRTELLFGPGITAIVGPNGSGKSNLFDAVRWVLGETSWRALRSQRTEDVIFAGSATRRPHGLAQVELTVDNEDGSLPVEFSEVTVTRRATRAGEGEFFLNRTPCRLRDIQTLFLGTGVGGRAYAMIGQGEVDSVLDASPAERRALLEEAAGLSRYKRRCSEAERRRDHARQNLSRVQDLLAELEARTRELAAQAERTRLHREYRERLAAAELALRVEEYRRLRTHLRRLEGQREAARERRQRAVEALERLEQELAGARAEVQRASRALDAAQAELVAAVEEAGRVEQEARIAAERVEAARQIRDRLAEQLRRAEASREEDRKQMAELRQQLAACELALEEASGRLRQAQEDLERAQVRAREAETALEAARAEVLELEHARSQALAGRTTTLGRLEALRKRERFLAAQLERLAEERAQVEAQRARLAAELQSVQQQVRRVESEVGDLKARVQQARVEAAQAEEARRQLALRREVDAARLQVLEDARRDLVGYEAGVRRLLLAQREEPGRLLGIRGALVDYLDVDREYLAAVEAALADRLCALVADSAQVARSALAEVATHGASFVLLDLAAAVDGAAAEPPPVEGVVGRAADLVRCPPLVEPVVRAALAGTLVVRDLDTALRVRALGWEGRVVTLSGELLTPDALLASRRNGDQGPLGWAQEMAALRASLEEAARLDEELSRRVAGAVEAASAAEAEAAAREQEMAARAGQARRLGEELARAEAVLAQRPALEEEARLELADLRAQAEEVEAEARRQADLLRRIEEELASARAALELARAASEQASRASASASDRVTSLRVELAEVAARREGLAARAAEREAEGEAVEAGLAALRAELEAASGELVRLEQAASDARRRSAQVQDQLQRGRLAVSEAGRARESAEALVLELEARRAEAQDALRACDEEVQRLEVRTAQLEAEVSSSARRIEEEHGVGAEEADARVPVKLDRDELLGEVEGLRGLLSALGPVNQRAVEEHAEVQHRAERLRHQVEDVAAAADLLGQLAARLEEALHRRFEEAFEEVQYHFADCFRRLFGGGSGALQLVRDESGEVGVEITAQPPGKKVRSLSALSGGERVLVALALVFALLRTHPSPFCVFDEIEAALDDANTRRVAELLRELAQRSQVVIITHNKATMEAADVLYGVTTEEPGVSSVVSVRVGRTAPEVAGVR